MSRFNIRAYGILIRDNSVLLTIEHRNGLSFRKFPGGGLEPGEGLIDCVKRECMEELGHRVKVIQHFYTTDFYQPSAFDKNKQLISVYYRIDFEDDSDAYDYSVLKSLEKEITLQWIPLSKIDDKLFMFPVDRVVAGMLKETYTGYNNIS